MKLSLLFLSLFGVNAFSGDAVWSNEVILGNSNPVEKLKCPELITPSCSQDGFNIGLNWDESPCRKIHYAGYRKRDITVNGECLLEDILRNKNVIGFDECGIKKITNGNEISYTLMLGLLDPYPVIDRLPNITIDLTCSFETEYTIHSEVVDVLDMPVHIEQYFRLNWEKSVSLEVFKTTAYDNEYDFVLHDTAYLKVTADDFSQSTLGMQFEVDDCWASKKDAVQVDPKQMMIQDGRVDASFAAPLGEDSQFAGKVISETIGGKLSFTLQFNMFHMQQAVPETDYIYDVEFHCLVRLNDQEIGARKRRHTDNNVREKTFKTTVHVPKSSGEKSVKAGLLAIFILIVSSF